MSIKYAKSRKSNFIYLIQIIKTFYQFRSVEALMLFSKDLEMTFRKIAKAMRAIFT